MCRPLYAGIEISDKQVERRMRNFVLGLIVYCAALLLAGTPLLAQTAMPTIIEQCEKLLAPDRPTFSGPNAPSIRITSPTDGSDFYGSSVTISVDIQNFDMNTTDGRHWHLWVNGQLQGMVYQKDVTIDLTPGTYQLCATLGDANHADVGEPSGVNFTVHEAAAGTPTTPASFPSGTGNLIPETGITPGQIALVIILGLAAAVGGWWFGSRLPKRRE